MIHVHGHQGDISPATRGLAGRVALVLRGRRLIVTPRDYHWMPVAVEEVDS